MSSKSDAIDSPDFPSDKASKDEEKQEKGADEEKVEAKNVLQEYANKNNSSVKTHEHQEAYEDFISNLSPEVVLKILMWLDPIDIAKLALTCHKMRAIAEDEKLWESKCKEADLKDILNSRDKEILEDRNMENPFQFSSFKANFVKHHQREMNFIRNPIERPIVLEASECLECLYNLYTTFIELFNNKVIGGSGNNIKVWCAFTGDCLLTLTGHTDNVETVQMNQEFIISGSDDKTLKVWSFTTGACLHTLLGHTGQVMCSHLSGDVLVSGSWDKTVRLWNVREGKCLNTLEGHQDFVWCVQFNRSMSVVASGGGDGVIKIWDTETSNSLHTLSGHLNPVEEIKFYGDHMVSLGEDHTKYSVKVWNTRTGACLHTIPVLWSGENTALQENILATPNYDGTAKIWNILTGSCLHTLDGPNKHTELITSIQYENKYVVTASKDGTIKLWDVKNGQFIRNLLELEEGEKLSWMKMKDAKIVVCTKKDSHETEMIVLNFDINY